MCREEGSIHSPHKKSLQKASEPKWIRKRTKIPLIDTTWIRRAEVGLRWQTVAKRKGTGIRMDGSNGPEALLAPSI